MGWNGVTLHCEHKSWPLGKGDSFTSEAEDADIMIDVQDARVLLQWPREKCKLATPADSDSAWDGDSPSRGRAMYQHSPLQSPLRRRVRLQSPVSPSEAIQASTSLLPSAPELSAPSPIHVYVDEDVRQEEELAANTQAQTTQSTQIASQPLSGLLDDSQSSVLSDPHDYSDNDEENDPIVHCFGPFGANLDSRMAAINAHSSPAQARPALSPLKISGVSPQRLRHAGPSREKEEEIHPVINHVINQLAYSRLASTPLSTIMSHLPAHFKDTKSNSKENTALTPGALKRMLDSTGCIGEVVREGKDAAGKPLESEFYYIPDMDDDASRRDSVVDGLRKPGLRACRKQHKVRHSAQVHVSPTTKFLLTLMVLKAILLAQTEIAALTSSHPSEMVNSNSIATIFGPWSDTNDCEGSLGNPDGGHSSVTFAPRSLYLSLLLSSGYHGIAGRHGCLLPECGSSPNFLEDRLSGSAFHRRSN